MNPPDRLNDAMKSLGIDGKTMARGLGVTGASVSEWRSGKSPIKQPTAMALQLLYGVSWKWLMEGEGPMWVPTASGEAVPPAPAPSRAPAVRHLVAAQLAAAQCQAAGVAADPEALVASYRDLLQRLGDDKPARERDL